MTTEQLRIAHRASPFRPFVMRMADGRKFEVRHPEFLAIAPSGRTAAIYEAEDAASVIDLLLMTEIEFFASASSAG